MDKVHVFVVKLFGWGVSVAVAEDGLNVCYELGYEWVFEVETSGTESTVQEFAWDVLLDGALVECSPEDGAHDDVYLFS